ncbi:dehydrogenase/reductase SDR family member 4-like isoform X1 [Lissotriton helveticus]
MLTLTGGKRMFSSLIKSDGIHRQPALRNLRSLLRLCSSAVEWKTVHAGKVAVLTGSTEGIGFAIARRLAQQGAHVVVSSRKQENVDRAIQELKSENLSVSGTVCSVANKDHRKNLVELALEKYGRIDYLLSNASIGIDFKNVFDTTEEEWNEILHTNVIVQFLLVKAVVPHMQKVGGGSIVLTSSVASYTFYPNLGPYCVSKTAIVGMIKILASELALLNIRLNSLAPGPTLTKYQTRHPQSFEPLLNESMKIYGFRRMAEPGEHAGLVSFLFSSDASYITGETIVVGGGFKTRL